MAAQGRLFASLDGPDARGFILAGRRQALAVGCKCDRAHRRRMAETAQLASARGIPQAQALVVAAGGEGLAVGGKRHREHDIGMAGERFEFLAACYVPQAHALVA